VTRARTIFHAYLKQVGQLQPVKLGEKAALGHPTEEDNRALEERIVSASRSTRSMIGVMTGMLIVVFALGIFLILSAAGSIGAVASLSAGTLWILLVIVERLRRLWIERSVLDLAWASVREWPPENVLALVEILYWHSLSPRKGFRKPGVLKNQQLDSSD
jgi:hypothetical protein